MKKAKKFFSIINIPDSQKEYYEKLLAMTGNEIYQKYGLKRDEFFSFMSRFPNGYDMEIRLIISEDESRPYTEAILYDGFSEVCFSEPEGYLVGEWILEDDEKRLEFHVNIK